jgi:hypothetical protein
MRRELAQVTGGPPGQPQSGARVKAVILPPKKTPEAAKGGTLKLKPDEGPK